MAYLTLLIASKAPPPRRGHEMRSYFKSPDDGDAHMFRKGIIVATLLLAACATTPQTETASERDCFRASSVNGYSVIDDHNVRLTVGANRYYVLNTAWNVRDLDWTHAIAIRSATGRICTGRGLDVDIIGGDPRRTYPITSIARLPDQPAVQGR
jgi:hypothetical protein